MRIGIVAGEASGDILGADLMRALKYLYPSCQFSGIGGELMLSQGFVSLYPQDRLAVMGFIEPLKRLPELLHIRRHLFTYFVEHRMDVVIGIDSPDFNLALEKKLRHNTIKTVHYVSPSVWAWRQGRISLIKQAVDLMLTLLPFEADFYQRHHVPVEFVGHPLANQFALEPDHHQARLALQRLSPDFAAWLSSPDMEKEGGKTLVACLPGSRQGEVNHIGPTLWHAMKILCQQNPSVCIVVPALNQQRYQQIQHQLEIHPDLNIKVVIGYSHEVMAAADVVVMASGTTTLEAMLLKKPMVVVYKKDTLSYEIISRLMKVEHISLPNLLAGERLVAELLQKEMTPDNIVSELTYWLDNPQATAQLQHRFTELHHQIRLNASEKAAQAIENLLQNTK
jgi:lipid-A-disaccharide synthase